MHAAISSIRLFYRAIKASGASMNHRYHLLRSDVYWILAAFEFRRNGREDRLGSSDEFRCLVKGAFLRDKTKVRIVIRRSDKFFSPETP